LKQRGLSVKGLVFNGIRNSSTEEVVLAYTQLPVIAYIPQLEKINAASIQNAANTYIDQANL